MAKKKQFLNSEEVSEIYRDNRQFIYKVIRFHLGDSPEVEDAFQSFFLRLLEKPVPKKETVNQRPYLYRMITNSIVDDVRRTKAYKKHISKYSANYDNKSSCCPCEKLIQEEQIDSILNTIESSLPAHLSKTLKLRYKENYSNDQIVDAITAKKRTVIKYLSDGLKRLRMILNKPRTNR